jgi:hypothetical protein
MKKLRFSLRSLRGSGFGAWSFEVYGLGLRFNGNGFKVDGSGFVLCNLRLRAYSFGEFRVQF